MISKRSHETEIQLCRHCNTFSYIKGSLCIFFAVSITFKIEKLFYIVIIFHSIIGLKSSIAFSYRILMYFAIYRI